MIKITKYKAKDKTSCGTPKLVKLDRNHFFLLWTETKNSKTGSRCTAMAQIDGQGRRVSKIVRKNLILSDCDPVLMGDGTICWYASENKTMRVFRVNVFHPELAPEMPTEISLVKSMSLKKGSKVSLSPVMKSDFAQTQLTWSSSAPKTVSVTKDGVIRALAAGSAKITVKTDNGLSAVCKVKVTKAESKYTLTKPVITKAKVKGHEITLSWKKLSSKMRKNVSKVEIQISTGSKFTWRIARRTQPSKTQLVLKGLMKKKTYFIRVRYIAKDGSVSAWSRTKKVKTKT